VASKTAPPQDAKMPLMTPEQRFRRAARRYRDAEAKADEARAELRAAMLEARNAGLTLAAMAQVLGVSRQRAQQQMRAAERG
jgi:hypothetical protein